VPSFLAASCFHHRDLLHYHFERYAQLREFGGIQPGDLGAP
jgi:hypothetical protein